jgi:hypothetical protein
MSTRPSTSRSAVRPSTSRSAVRPSSSSQRESSRRSVRSSTSKPQFSVEDYVDDVVGSGVWKRILERESEYWRTVLDNSADRVDAENPVGGLIDITDHVPQLADRFDLASQVGAHIKSKIHRHFYNTFRYNEMYLDQLTAKVLRDPSVMVISGSFPLSFITKLEGSDLDIFFTCSDRDCDRLSQLVRDQILDDVTNDYFVSTEHSISAQFSKPISIEGEWKPIEEVKNKDETVEDFKRHRFLNNYEVNGDMTKDQGYALPIKYQLVLRKYKSVTEILNGFDIGCCGVAIYQGRLYATERAIYEIVNRTIMVSTSRASTTYIKRLRKYIRRGFAIHVEGVSQFHVPHDNYYDNEDNIEIMSSLEYLYGRLKFSCGWDGEGRRNRIQGYLREVGKRLAISNGSDYSGGNYIYAPKWLVYGYKWLVYGYKGMESKSGKSLGSYTECVDGDKRKIEMFKRELLKKIPFITVRPYRQGSLSHLPIEIKLEDWTGTRFVTFGNSVPNSIVIYDPVKDIQSRLNSFLDSDKDELPQLVQNLSELVNSILGGNSKTITTSNVDTTGLVEAAKQERKYYKQLLSYRDNEINDLKSEIRELNNQQIKTLRMLENERNKYLKLAEDAKKHDMLVGLLSEQVAKLTLRNESE